MPEMNKKHSIYVQLLSLLLAAAFLALAAFGILSFAGQYLMERYLEESDYTEKKDQEYIEKLQSYIEREKISTRDEDKLETWVKKQRILFIEIYKDRMLVFDSEYPQDGVWEEEIEADGHGWETSYMVEFTDSTAEVFIFGSYAYQLYNYVMIGEIIFSFFLFLILVFGGIRGKMRYIRKLSEEIEILEGGNLDYKITIKGKDELAALAEGLDDMRLSFGSMIRREAEMVQANQRIVTEMSHDLRTPVTSIILYTEILKKGKYSSNEQFLEYLDKIDKKACRMKQLTEHLFEYSLIAGEDGVELEQPEEYGILFYDLFSETISYLEQQGFRVVFQIEWIDCMLQVSTDYVSRIFDNVTSNIVKYADPSAPVKISSVEETGMVGFLFENKIRTLDEKKESTGIGIQNMKNMMKKMKGKCVIKEEGKSFCVVFSFPCFQKC